MFFKIKFQYIQRLKNLLNNVYIKKNNIMSKKSIYIPIKVVPYIFVSIAAITIAATTNIIIQYLRTLFMDNI